MHGSNYRVLSPEADRGGRAGLHSIRLSESQEHMNSAHNLSGRRDLNAASMHVVGGQEHTHSHS